MSTLPQPLPIHRETAGPAAGVVTVTLEQPGKPVVVLDQELIQRLESALKTIPANAAGLVLASASERVFVAGADLKSISEWDDGALMRYLEYGARVFAMLSNFPFPTVAAINGAALGGGLELAMHCDALIAAPSGSGKPYPVGLPEAGLGLCPGWGGTNLLPARMEPGEAIRRTASGTPLTFDEAVGAKLFDHVVGSPADLLGASRMMAARLRQRPWKRDGAPSKWIGRPETSASVLAALDSGRASLPDTDAARAVAEAVDAGLTRGWAAALDIERKRLTAVRHTPSARQALEAFFAKSGKK